MAAGERGAGPRPHRADGVALVRHRRRPARLAAFPDLADLGLGEELQVERDLREHSRRDLQRGAELGDAHAVRVPGHRRLGEVELPGEECRDLDPTVTQRRERPGGSAELRCETPIRELASRARASSTATSHPAALSPNVVGTACCSSVRPAIGVSRCVRASVAQASATPPSSASTSPSALRATSIAAVSITSWLVAPRCTHRAVLLAHPCDECPDERLRRRAGASCLDEQLLPVVLVGGARGGDRRRRGGGDDASGRARVRERPLRVEHRAEPRAPRDRVLQRGGDEQRLERGHPAKNVVCCGPCKRMSKRRPPSSATAMSVSRRSGERRDSTGSASFASASSGK